MLAYLRNPLDWTEDSPYEILTGKVNPWKDDGHDNLSGALAEAMTANPHLRLLAMCGATDLATPPAGIQYSLRHLPLPRQLRANIRTEHYSAGHMFYLNPPNLAKMRRDLVKFLNPPTPPAPVTAPATRESPPADATSESPDPPR